MELTSQLLIGDDFITSSGMNLSVHCYGHATVRLSLESGLCIYVDPVGVQIGRTMEPQADLILLTHAHGDHLDVKTVKSLLKKNGAVVGAKSCQCALMCQLALPGNSFSIKDIEVAVIPAYNVTLGHIQYHPKERGDVGYVLNVGGSRIYFAGDTEDVSEVCALRDIDVAFLPVNQPYTMTIDQVVHVAREMRPKVLYPYHYGSSAGVTDVTPLVHLLKDVCEVRIRSME